MTEIRSKDECLKVSSSVLAFAPPRILSPDFGLLRDEFLSRFLRGAHTRNSTSFSHYVLPTKKFIIIKTHELTGVSLDVQVIVATLAVVVIVRLDHERLHLRDDELPLVGGALVGRARPARLRGVLSIVSRDDDRELGAALVLQRHAPSRELNERTIRDDGNSLTHDTATKTTNVPSFASYPTNVPSFAQNLS